LHDDRSVAGAGPLYGRDIEDPWHLNEIARRRRVSIDAQRSLGANLSEGLALIEFLSGFTGVCRR